MRLFDLIMQTALEAYLKPPLTRTNDIVIAGLTSDSRMVKHGYLFAALRGGKIDGHHYIADAIERGAVAILTEPDTALPPSAHAVTIIEDPNPRRRLALMAARFYEHQPKYVAAVTGTNGKTSTATFVRQIWQALGQTSASMGTLGVETNAAKIAAVQNETHSMTTPDPVALHRVMAELAKAGVTHLAMEASSHGLDQFRMDGVRVDVAGFTNLTRDHLDYHGSMQNYFNAKARLFREVMKPNSTAVINADSDYGPQLAQMCRVFGHRVISYGKNGADLTLRAQTPRDTGQTLDLTVFGKEYTIDIPVVGTFQGHNALCALGIVLAHMADDRDYERAVTALGSLNGVRGRLERVGVHPLGANLYVDYAHTPDALEVVLKALRPHTSGRLMVLFGCGGDRDNGKRPIMGEIANRLADLAIVTDDNPRTENPKKIRAQILAACAKGREIADRREAIQYAVKLLRAGDTLVVAGKGHENGQIIDQIVYPFDDAAEVRAALAGLK